MSFPEAPTSDGVARREPAGDVTLLMQAAGGGDRAATDRLLEVVYQQLRQSAEKLMRGEPGGATLSATGLVHEAYLKLAGPREVPWANRAHFYAAAGEAMRRIIIDRARSRGAAARARKRWAEARDLAELDEADSEDVLAFDQALVRLEAEDAQAAQVVRLRFFAGLSIDATADALGVSARTVDREWRFARAWLTDAMATRRA